MNICIAMDAFKGSLTSVEGAGAVREGILSVSEPVQNQIEIFPFGDGGEGTMEALLEGLGGQKIRAMVTGADGFRKKNWVLWRWRQLPGCRCVPEICPHRTGPPVGWASL